METPLTVKHWLLQRPSLPPSFWQSSLLSVSSGPLGVRAGCLVACVWRRWRWDISLPSRWWGRASSRWMWARTRRAPWPGRMCSNQILLSLYRRWKISWECNILRATWQHSPVWSRGWRGRRWWWGRWSRRNSRQCQQQWDKSEGEWPIITV